MTIQTTIGKTYAVTSAAECTITTPEGILIATCAAGEQTLFVAPATEIEISDDAALVTESFKGAPAGSAAAGGLNNRQAAAVSDIVENHLNNTITEPHTTATGTDNANFKWCQFAPTRILPGTVAAISMPCRTTESSLITTSPVYLSVFQLNAGGEYEHVGISENAVEQAIGQTSRWTFRKLQLTGRTTRLCPVPDTSTKWTDKLVLGGRVTPVSGEDSKITPISGSGAYVAEVSLEYAHQEPKYATVPVVERHVSDTGVHITEEERTAWNNKADASALSSKVNTATFNSHTGNNIVHVTAEERAAWNAKQDSIVNEEGVATVFRCAVYDASYSLFCVLTGEAVWQNRSSGTFGLRGDDDYSMGVTLSVGRSNGEPARIIKQNQQAPLTPTDVPNREEGNACWVKFRIDMTDAQYEEAASAGTLDATTLYVTSDGGKVYLGTNALN